MATITPALPDSPKRPDGIMPIINRDYTKQFVSVQGYTQGQRNVLTATIDDVETEIDLRTYDRMERDTTIIKSKRILITNVLSDDLQFAPGATEEEASEDDYKFFVGIMEFCQRVIAGLADPYKTTCEQTLGNGIKHGHGIGEIEWEKRMDQSVSKPLSSAKVPKKSRLSSIFGGLFSSKADTNEAKPDEAKPLTGRLQLLEGEHLRLMPKAIKVKPRGAALFVTDEYMEVLGLTPRVKGRANLQWNEIIDRAKFIVLTLNKQDEDPRGKSEYRTAFNWFNLKAQLPAEMLRYILQEAVPQAVGTLPQDMMAFEFVRDEAGNIIYEDPDTRKTPKMKTAAESMHDQIKNFRSGSGAVIPFGATLTPFKKSGTSDANLFQIILKVIDDQIENAILLQTLAQSEGAHHGKAAAVQVAELLYAKVFWLKWGLAMMTMTDLLENAVRFNFGDWAVKYLPQISFGDFIRRDWNTDLASLADAYFKGFLDDSQRAELMAWMNLPRAGESRAETIAQMDPTTGSPVMPNPNRPDKQKGNKDRNAGNGTEKKKDANKKPAADIGRSPFNALVYNRGSFVRAAKSLLSGRR